MSFVTNLDTPLLRLSSGDLFTARDACGGVHVFGGIGQGKTSGSGKMLAGAFLRAGAGGLVTAVKPDEIDLWKHYAREHGRSDSLILFNENEGFNFLTYELARQGMEGIGTVTECLMRVLEAAKKASPTATQKGGEAFWEESTRMLLRYSILPLYAASGTLTMGDIIRFVSSAPRDLKDVTNPDWQAGSFMYSVMDKAARHPVIAMEAGAMQNTLHYWSERWPVVPDKTRENIVITVAATLDRFMHGRLKKAFCGQTTIVPEMSFLGSIIVLCMPTLTWNEDGIIAQHLFKFLWERSVLTRNSLPQKYRERLLYLWSDEAQETANSFDGEFLGMCRSSKCCVCYLTQSLPNYYAKMGGDNPRDAAHALVGKFVSHIYHGNSCPDTNDYASRVIGKVMKRRANYSSGKGESYNVGMNEGSTENWGVSSNVGSSSGSSSGSQSSSNSGHNHGSGHNSGAGANWGANRGRGTSSNESRGYSESMEFAIEPGDFARILKNGGKANGGIVTGIWFQAGKVFKATETNIMLKAFKQ